MEDPFGSFLDMDAAEEIKQALQNSGAAAGVEKAQEYLEKQNKIPLNIGITGESGSGKSTFVNAFRGIDNRDERAAPTGCVETTSEVTPYPHPNYPNVTLWDLPGIGTVKFPADKYLQHVGFERFDFFIIISADRFRENDVKLALEIQRMGKKFYFVRSKIDHNLHDAERSQRDFNAERTLEQIKENCIQGLQNQGVKAPQVFLVSSFELQLYDFPALQDTLEKELPAHKRHALLLAMPTISHAIIEKKKQALQSKIKYYALWSAGVAAVPLPGLSVAVDIPILIINIIRYKLTFGLDDKSLQNLALRAGVTLDDLTAVMKSPLAAKEITKELVVNILSMSLSQGALMAGEEGSRFIPLFGIPVAMAFSFTSTYRALSTFLDMVAEDAQNVLTRALGLNTSV
ncbi:interferon-inducible GTPase 5-like [Mastacembelus armatus]|uniref:Interferon-inducible GTPase 5-like n=1 Tax=Mastacembelus armatus TaxID=205130 RepID=A0A3Q3MB59_9TELE|nr:interferon-inducible GTPase 5-like [Mastacembelus armatus]